MIVISATDSVQTGMLYMGVCNVATASQVSHAYMGVSQKGCKSLTAPLGLALGFL